jgi:hypothetical protein
MPNPAKVFLTRLPLLTDIDLSFVLASVEHQSCLRLMFFGYHGSFNQHWRKCQSGRADLLVSQKAAQQRALPCPCTNVVLICHSLQFV